MAKTVLSIETSCDETGVSILRLEGGNLEVLSNLLYSQIAIHAPFGGVVPEVAARQQALILPQMVEQSLAESRLEPEEIDFIAVTYGPGLITSLMVGVEAARTLSYAWDKPILPVNHLSGHLWAGLAPFGRPTGSPLRDVRFPALGLIVSGGHTELVLVKDFNDYKIIGSTRDDAVGEAFDKVAKLLNLGYPGGPAISKLSQSGNPEAVELPRPMINDKSYDFSFSGLKTAVRYWIQDHPQASPEDINDLCASFEQAVVDVLWFKTEKALQEFGVSTLIMGGGVVANKKLRESFVENVKKYPDINFILPEIKLTGDNSMMIAIAALVEERVGKKTINWQDLKVDPNLKF